jgi:hypothetical protein
MGGYLKLVREIYRKLKEFRGWVEVGLPQIQVH